MFTTEFVVGLQRFNIEFPYKDIHKVEVNAEGNLIISTLEKDVDGHYISYIYNSRSQQVRQITWWKRKVNFS